jgi:hypothetical protein
MARMFIRNIGIIDENKGHNTGNTVDNGEYSISFTVNIEEIVQQSVESV